jgi:hypothetical protein
LRWLALSARGYFGKSQLVVPSRKLDAGGIGVEHEEACEQALTQKLGSDSDLYSKNTNTEVMIDHQAGQPRLWARTKGHPELPIVTTYVCLPDTVEPRGVKGK